MSTNIAESQVPASSSNTAAAAFQLAIWGIVQGSISGGVVTADWSWLDGGATTATTYGAVGLISDVNTYNGPLADGLVGLNREIPPGGTQSYVVQGVPDGGATMMLLGGALIGLGVLRRKFRL